LLINDCQFLFLLLLLFEKTERGIKRENNNRKNKRIITVKGDPVNNKG
jgi:hypothetical protein